MAKSQYATLEPDLGGSDYRMIASVLTKGGDIMGHSTVRNILLRLLERFAAALMAHYGVIGDPAHVAKDPEFQRGLASLIQEIAGGENNGN